jgi:hypothetical protein
MMLTDPVDLRRLLLRDRLACTLRLGHDIDPARRELVCPATRVREALSPSSQRLVCGRSSARSMSSTTMTARSANWATKDGNGRVSRERADALRRTVHHQDVDVLRS